MVHGGRKRGSEEWRRKRNREGEGGIVVLCPPWPLSTNFSLIMELMKQIVNYLTTDEKSIGNQIDEMIHFINKYYRKIFY